MPLSSNRDEPSPRNLADLSALADGTLDPAREPAVRELIAGSPELRERFERERTVVAALHATRAERAPERLRARIEAQRRAAERRPRARWVYGGAAAAALAAVILALVLVLPAGTPGAPSVSQAAQLALQGPALPAPAPSRAHPDTKLSRDVQEIYFPNWARSFGWTASGMRVDHLAGRPAVTVYYTKAGRQIAYTILAAPPLHWPGTRPHWVGGTELQAFVVHGRLAVTWRRAGHTCVLSGSGVSAGQLLNLAAWKAPGLEQ